MQDMTEVKIFLADTYALIELLGGNPNYKPYLNHALITTKFNLVELYYHFLHDYGKETADKYLQLYSKFVIPITYSSIRKGMEFKLKHEKISKKFFVSQKSRSDFSGHKKENLSYVDCIGYALALELGVKFLTGDEKFENKDNVEYVK